MYRFEKVGKSCNGPYPTHIFLPFFLAKSWIHIFWDFFACKKSNYVFSIWRSVGRWAGTRKNAKKSLIFPSSRHFQSVVFQIWWSGNLDIWWNSSLEKLSFFLDLMVFTKYNSLFEKDHCMKKKQTFLRKNRPTFRPSVIY